MNNLKELIEQYWDCAYQQGIDRRERDNEAGDAQRLEAEIDDTITNQAAEIAALLSELADINNALGTSEGHSSVYHIEALQAENTKLELLNADYAAKIAALKTAACETARKYKGE